MRHKSAVSGILAQIRDWPRFTIYILWCHLVNLVAIPKGFKLTIIVRFWPLVSSDKSSWTIQWPKPSFVSFPQIKISWFSIWFFHKIFLNFRLEAPGHLPHRNPCQLKHQHWTKRPDSHWEEYFVRIWKRINGELVSEMVPLHVSEYYKPAALWIFHAEGEILIRIKMKFYRFHFR